MKQIPILLDIHSYEIPEIATHRIMNLMNLLYPVRHRHCDIADIIIIDNRCVYLAVYMELGTDRPFWLLA
jgi:hypothetical protein